MNPLEAMLTSSLCLYLVQTRTALGEPRACAASAMCLHPWFPTGVLTAFQLPPPTLPLGAKQQAPWPRGPPGPAQPSPEPPGRDATHSDRGPHAWSPRQRAEPPSVPVPPLMSNHFTPSLLRSLLTMGPEGVTFSTAVHSGRSQRCYEHIKSC